MSELIISLAAIGVGGLSVSTLLFIFLAII